MTDETNDSIVVNPRRTQAISPNIHRCSRMVTTVIGMFNTETSKSAKTRLRRKALQIVRRVFLLMMTKIKLMFPKTDAEQMKTRMAVSMIEPVRDVMTKTIFPNNKIASFGISEYFFLSFPRFFFFEAYRPLGNPFHAYYFTCIQLAV